MVLLVCCLMEALGVELVGVLCTLLLAALAFPLSWVCSEIWLGPLGSSLSPSVPSLGARVTAEPLLPLWTEDPVTVLPSRLFHGGVFIVLTGELQFGLHLVPQKVPT